MSFLPKEEVVSHLRHKVKHHHKKDAKHEYYMSQHVDHPDADAKNIAKHGVSLEEASMQADGANGINGGEKKLNKFADIPISDMKLQKINGEASREEKPRNHHHHQRHEVKVREEAKSEGSVEEEVMKDEAKSDTREERKISKRKDVMEKSESRKVEEVKLEGKTKSEDEKIEKTEAKTEKAEKKTEKGGKTGRRSKNQQDGKKGKGRKHNGQQKGKKHNKKAKTDSKPQKNGKKQRKNNSTN